MLATETGRYAYCFCFLETVEHLFCTCPIAVTLYRTIQEWCAPFNITLPEMDPVTIIYGIFSVGANVPYTSKSGIEC